VLASDSQQTGGFQKMHHALQNKTHAMLNPFVVNAKSWTTVWSSLSAMKHMVSGVGFQKQNGNKGAGITGFNLVTQQWLG
jgi:hypothetical protein